MKARLHSVSVQRDANKASKEHFTTINIPVKANTFEAGND